MTRNSDNRRRAFADVVTVEAWHDDFADGKLQADLHADVVFGTARVGGEAESPVRFRLSLRRAEIAVIVPESEPVSVDKKSVSRDSSELEGTLTETTERTALGEVKGKANLSVSATTVSAGASLGAAGAATISTSQKIAVSGTIRFALVTQSQTEEGFYRWMIEPRTGRQLVGRPWDAITSPRLRLVDTRKDRRKGIPPTVRVEVRCRREDLIIEDLEIKDEGLWQTVKTRAGFNNKMAAAISYIRDRLANEGLEVENMSDVFGRLTIASTTAEAV